MMLWDVSLLSVVKKQSLVDENWLENFIRSDYTNYIFYDSWMAGFYEYERKMKSVYQTLWFYVKNKNSQSGS